jgi:hypothetical protein
MTQIVFKKTFKKLLHVDPALVFSSRSFARRGNRLHSKDLLTVGGGLSNLAAFKKLEPEMPSKKDSALVFLSPKWDSCFEGC